MCLTHFVQDAAERERTMQETIERERVETARVKALKQQLKQEREEHEEARGNTLRFCPQPACPHVFCRSPNSPCSALRCAASLSQRRWSPRRKRSSKR